MPSSIARRAFGFVCVAVCAALLTLESGCTKKTTKKYYTTQDTSLTDAFPGTPSSDSNVADDGKAFNGSGHKINHGLNTFWNAANGTAIVLYLDEFEGLHAHYFDGAQMLPGVELRAPNQEDQRDHDDDDLNTFQIYRVLFLNTAGAANPNAQARNGDALIAWVRKDLTPPAGMDPDANGNSRLYASYFDRTLASTPVSATDSTVRYGFQTVVNAVDFDNKRVGAGDDSVTSFGFVSDSLRFSHAFDRRQSKSTEFYPRENGDMMPAPATRSGDPTSLVYLVWRKAEFDDFAVADRFHALEFDLTQSGNAIPAQTSADEGRIEPPVGVATLGSGTPVNAEFVVHDDVMAWLGTDTNAHEVLFATRFAHATPPETIELGDTVAVNASIDVPWAVDLYGGDHDLRSLYAIFPRGNDLMCAKADLDASPFARELQAIDASANSVGGTFRTRINRTRQWIFALWDQDDGAGFNKVTCNAIQTRNSAATAARTLANSLATAAAVPNQTTFLAQDVAIQWEIADGRSDPACGVQSDHDRINFAFLETTASLQSLIHNGLIFTAGANPTTPPTVAYAVTGGSPAGLLDQNHTGYSPIGGNMHPIVTDLGTSDGAPLVYYLRNDNNPTNNAAPGAFNEVRVFGCAGLAGATPALVSTDGPGNDNAMNTGENMINDLDDFINDTGDLFRVQTLPLNHNIAANPDFGGTAVHLFFREPRFGSNSYPALRTRRFVKGAFAPATPATFGTAHQPPLTAAPQALDTFDGEESFLLSTTDEDGDRAGPFVSFVSTDGTARVGIYFQTRMHMLYQEFSGSSWIEDRGQPAPIPVDAEGTGLFGGRDQQALPFSAQRLNSCDTMTDSLVFYSKSLAGDDPGRRRWFVRIHD